MLPATRFLIILCLLRAGIGAADSVRPAAVASSASYITELAKGKEARAQRQYRSAVAAFRNAADIARQAHNQSDQAKALQASSGCNIRLFEYREALADARKAEELGRSIHDDTIIGAAANNEATLYQELGDYELAEAAGARAIEALGRSPQKDYFLSALINYGDILGAECKAPQSTALLKQALALARSNGKPAFEAMADAKLGAALLDANDIAGAEEPLQQALTIYSQLHDTDAAQLTRSNLAVLALDKHNYNLCLTLLDQISQNVTPSVRALPPFWASQLRAQALEGLGHAREALTQYEKAVATADEWRRSSLVSDASSTSTLVLLSNVYAQYVTAAANSAISDHSPVLARRALAVLIDSRAATLREQMLLALSKQMQLPPRYFELLTQIQSTQAAVTLGGNSRDLPSLRAKLQRLRQELVETENGLGVAELPEQQASHSVADIRAHLGPDELLLSFSLHGLKSFVWAITKDRIELYRVPAPDVLAAHAKAFTAAAQSGDPTAAGRVLSGELFGQLPKSLSSKSQWLIAADGALLESVPFSALPDPASPSANLTAAHSIRLTPSERLLAEPSVTALAGTFIGVADPIYNLADARQSRSKRRPPVKPTFTRITLARLVSSEREVRNAASLNGFRNVQLLTGASANDQNLRAALATAPEVLHFAVHVVSPDDATHGDEAALALSLNSDNVPQFLTKETISTLRVPGSLVVLSGCASEQGKALPGAGLMGLSRAWLLAGASAVLVTAWPTPDDSGQFFTNFYSHFHAQSNGGVAERAAAALRATQIDMQRSSEAVRQPSFWAAYSLISKE